jgi:hypothetical protein
METDHQVTSAGSPRHPFADGGRALWQLGRQRYSQIGNDFDGGVLEGKDPAFWAEHQVKIERAAKAVSS